MGEVILELNLLGVYRPMVPPFAVNRVADSLSILIAIESPDTSLLP